MTDTKLIKLSSLKANLQREEKGDWVEYPFWPGASFKVSSLLLPTYATARDLLYQRLNREYKDKPIPQHLLRLELGKLYAQHILHDWKGFDIPYSPEAAAEILADPSYREVVSAVEWCAAKVAEINPEFVEEAGKNSDRPSASA